MSTGAVFQSILDRYHSIIRYAGHRFKVIAKIDPEDLYQEACIELLDMLDSGLDPDTVDFDKLFRTRMFNKMVDENRKFTRAESRELEKEEPGNKMCGWAGDTQVEMFDLLTDEDVLPRCGYSPVRDPSEEAESQELVDRVNNLLNRQEKRLWKLIVDPPNRLLRRIHRRSKGRKFARTTPGIQAWAEHLGWSRQKISSKLRSVRSAVITTLGNEVPDWLQRKLIA